MNKWLLSYVCVGLTSAAVSAVPFQDIIGEDVEFFVTLRSLSETRTEWQSHAFAELFEDESLLAFFAEIEDADLTRDDLRDDESFGFTEVLKNEFGLSYDELFELFPGQASVALYNLTEQVLNEEDSQEIVLLAEFSGDAERLNELMQVQFIRNAEAQQALNPLVEHEMVEESFMGETLYFDETFDGETTYVEDGYALVDGIMILAAPESRLRETVEWIKEGTDAPIGRSDAYLRAREEGGRGDLIIYTNLADVMPSFNRAWMDLPMIDTLAIFGVTAQSLNTALGLESMQAVFVDIDLVDQGVLSHFGLIYQEKSGLLSLLSYADGELPEAGYVPESALSSSVSLFDFSALFKNLEMLLNQASPTLLPLAEMQLQALQARLGVDIRAAILENMGERIVSVALLNESVLGVDQFAAPQQLFVLDVKDTQSFTRALEAVKDSVTGARSEIKEHVYEGETIYSIASSGDSHLPDAESAAVNYVLTRSNLIVNMGDVGLLHEVLSRMKNGDDGLWQKSQTQELFERIERPNAVTRSYLNAAQMVEPFFESLIEALKIGGLANELTAESIPSDLVAPYRLISEMNEAPDGLFGRTLMIKSEVDE